MGYIGEGINQTATSVETAKDEFFGTYYGQISVDPSVDPNGNPITDGDLFYNTSEEALKIRVNGEWLSLRTATTGYQQFTATSGQTTFDVAGSFSPGFVFVTLNGVVLSSDDYDDSSGTEIVLTDGAADGDILGVYLFDTFSVADTVSASSGGTFSGAVTFDDTIDANAATTFSSSATFSGAVSGDVVRESFRKSERNLVAFTKTGNDTAETQVDLFLEVDGTYLTIPSGTSINMPSTLTVGTDYAIWVAPDGTLEADESYTTPPTANGRFIGGFHYAPGGNASFSLNAGDGGTTPQINEYSFHDLKWKPSVADPRGLTLVGDGAFWCGIYHLAGDHLAGPPHRHGVNPARGGNPPDLVDGSGKYPDAQAMNIFESLWYHGFRTPRVEDFQLLAFGTNEEASRGSDPGTTGLPGGSTDAQFTSHWGAIQSTGVIELYTNASILNSTSDLPNPSRGNRLFVVRFAGLGGRWNRGSDSGSRFVNTRMSTPSFTDSGGRGVCDHVILP